MLPLEHSAILLTFIKLPFFIKIFVLSIFERLFYTGFTVIRNIRVHAIMVLPYTLSNWHEVIKYMLL